MDEQVYKEFRERFDERYKLKDDCKREMDDVKDQLAHGDKQFAVINTKLNAILWGVGVLGTAVIGFLVKYVFRA